MILDIPLKVFWSSSLRELHIHDSQLPLSLRLGTFFHKVRFVVSPKSVQPDRKSLMTENLAHQKSNFSALPSTPRVSTTQHFIWVDDVRMGFNQHYFSKLKVDFPEPHSRFHVAHSLDAVANIVLNQGCKYARVILCGILGRDLLAQLQKFETECFISLKFFVLAEETHFQQPRFVEECLRNMVGGTGSSYEHLFFFCNGRPVSDIIYGRYCPRHRDLAINRLEEALRGQKYHISAPPAGSSKQIFQSMTLETESGQDLKDLFLLRTRNKFDFIDYRFGGKSSSHSDELPTGEFSLGSSVEFPLNLLQNLGCVLPNSLAEWRDKICESAMLYRLAHQGEIPDDEYFRVMQALVVSDSHLSTKSFDAAFFYKHMTQVFGLRKYEEVKFF